VKEWFAGARADSMEIVSLRDPSVGDSTASYVSVDGEHFCHQIEDVVREPAGRPVGSWPELERWVRSWKVPGLTAIPSGRYPVGIDFSPRFRKPMLHVKQVPGYEGIRAHSGLGPKHSEGCLILGDELYQTPSGWRVKDGKSSPAVERLFDEVQAALERRIEVWWTLKRNPA
jgi:hypothetical protein